MFKVIIVLLLLSGVFNRWTKEHELPRKIESISAVLIPSHDAEKAANFEAAVCDLRAEKDTKTGLIYYYDKSSPQRKNYNNLMLYLVRSGDKVSMRMRFQTSNTYWLNVKSYRISTFSRKTRHEPDVSKTIRVDKTQMHRAEGNGAMWEWYDVDVDKEMTTTIADIIYSERATLVSRGDSPDFSRFTTDKERAAKFSNGENQSYSHRISQMEFQAIRHIVEAYKMMGGEESFD
ncbi:MAG: hypothetical protein ABIV51_09505 [Saprospiraceae bacterium]